MGHVERRHALLEAAERHRVVRQHQHTNTHALNQPHNLLRADQNTHNRVDRVIKINQTTSKRLRAHILALKVVDNELLLTTNTQNNKNTLAQQPQQPNPISLLQHQNKNKKLNQQTKLTLTLHHQIKQTHNIITTTNHHTHLPNLIINHHKNNQQPHQINHILTNHLINNILKLKIKHNLHLKPTLKHTTYTKPINKLLTHPHHKIQHLNPHNQKLNINQHKKNLNTNITILTQQQQTLIKHILKHKITPRQNHLKINNKIINHKINHNTNNQHNLIKLKLLNTQIITHTTILIIKLITKINTHNQFNTINTITKINQIQILHKNLTLQPLTHKIINQHHLTHLLKHNTIKLHPQNILNKLLNNNQSTLNHLTTQHILHKNPTNTTHINTQILIKTTILNNNNHIHHIQQQILITNKHTTLIINQNTQQLILKINQNQITHILILLTILKIKQIKHNNHHHPKQNQNNNQNTKQQKNNQQPTLLDTQTTNHK